MPLPNSLPICLRRTQTIQGALSRLDVWRARVRLALPTFLIAVAISTTVGPSAHGEDLTISSTPIPAFDATAGDNTTFGALEFLGGLTLISDHQDFGGLSGFRWLEDDNRFIAVTDQARVITGKLLRYEDKPTEITDAKITRIKNSSGKTITGKYDKDAESIERIRDHFVVGYERNDRVVFAKNRKGTLIIDGAVGEVNFNPFGFPENKGPEAVARHPGNDDLYMIAEHAINAKGNHRGFVLAESEVIREFSITLKNGYSITDAAFLPDGDLIVLERYFSLLTGVFMRMRRIAGSSLLGSDALDGPTLIEAGPGLEIDNMEGLAVSGMDDGSHRLTVVSDDNFSGRQRTVLLEFKLAD